MHYTGDMTKLEMIAKYGQQYYDDMVARSKAKLNAKYAAMSSEERSAVYQARKDQVKAWNAEHPERVQEIHRYHALAKYQKLNAEERRALYEKRYAARKAKLASDASYRAKQAAKQAIRFKRYDTAHPGLVRARSAAFEKANPHIKRANKHSRRAQGKMHPDFVKFLRQQPCIDCGTTERQITVGHLIPVTRGGTNHPCNLVAQCRSCNSKQNNKTHLRAMMVHYPQAALYAA